MTYAFFVMWFLVLYFGVCLAAQTFLAGFTLVACAIGKKDFAINLKAQAAWFAMALTVLIVFFYH